ncbi:PCMD domain-containing protein [Alistipes senegalensis]|uniref:PCMD domain-containing protein n=1 Tax=Alistipes senegalensis TaxID=1288121 RepID=UPI001E5A3680|nr:PCMD domain-containing protein [Alistipes senegalensis]
MKKTLLYALMLLCTFLFSGACTKEADPAAEGKGAVSFSLGMPRSTRAGGYDAYPWTECAIRVYKYVGTGEERTKELIRRYSSVGEMPGSIWLLAGDYSISVELGNQVDATFDEIFYRGETDFSIVAGERSDVQVECRIANTIIEVEYDETVLSLFKDELWTNVVLAERYNQQAVVNGEVIYLHYEESKPGYFILPEGVEAFSWRFRGVGTKPGDDTETVVMKDGTKHISTAPGMRYLLRYKYSPDLGGSLTFEITLDTSVSEKDDPITFAPDPQISGFDFDIDKMQEFGALPAISYKIVSIGDLASVALSSGGRSWNIECTTASESADGISVTMNSTSDMMLSLSEKFFAQFPAGDRTLTFLVEDEDGRSTEKVSVVRTQGVVSYTADCWNDKAELKAYVFDTSAADVKVRYRRKGAAEWSETPASQSAERGVYKATATGIGAASEYECQLCFGEKAINRSYGFSTASGPQVPNAGFEEWSGSSPLLPYITEQYWDSGNHGSSTMSKNVTQNVADPRPGSAGSTAAELNSQFVGLGASLGKFAAGNLFVGKYLGTAGTNGVIGFGKPFGFTYRPRQLKFWYKGTVGTVDYSGGGVNTGDSDAAQVYICLCEMNGPHVVDTRKSDTFFNPASKTVTYCSGALNKDSTNDRTDGKIIAYGEWINTTPETSEWTEVTVELHYNEEYEGTVPNYLMLTASASKYGDYFAGSTASIMYLDDVELVY